MRSSGKAYSTPRAERNDEMLAKHPAGSEGTSSINKLNAQRTRNIRRLIQRRTPASCISMRMFCTAASWLGEFSTLSMTSSTSTSVPGKREDRQSGKRLKVCRAWRQYHRGILVPGGVLRG